MKPYVNSGIPKVKIESLYSWIPNSIEELKNIAWKLIFNGKVWNNINNSLKFASQTLVFNSFPEKWTLMHPGFTFNNLEMAP